jgi:hypothetical protein
MPTMNDTHMEGYEPDYGFLRVALKVNGKTRRIWAKCVRRNEKVVVFLKVQDNGEPFI